MLCMYRIVKIKRILINKIAINKLCITKVQNVVFAKSIRPNKG
jgi:hypothetical protein